MKADGDRRRLDELAGSQLGLLTVDQLLQLGYTNRRVGIAVEQGRLVPVRRKVYRLAGTRLTWDSTVLAAVLSCPVGFVASHLTAAHLWRLLDDDLPTRTGPIELSGPHVVRMQGVVSHDRPVPRIERAKRFSVPVTSVGRTLLDLGVRMDAARLGPLTDEALRRGVVRLDQLRTLVTTGGTTDGRRRPGAIVLSEVLGDRLPGYDAGVNAWERKMDRAWERWGLPRAERQYEIITPGGVYRPDLAIVEERIAVDWNGFEFHGRRSKFDADSNRRGDLAAAGWLPLDFTSRSSPEHICSTVLSVVDARRGRAAG